MIASVRLALGSAVNRALRSVSIGFRATAWMRQDLATSGTIDRKAGRNSSAKQRAHGQTPPTGEACWLNGTAATSAAKSYSAAIGGTGSAGLTVAGSAEAAGDTGMLSESGRAGVSSAGSPGTCSSGLGSAIWTDSAAATAAAAAARRPARCPRSGPLPAPRPRRRRRRARRPARCPRSGPLPAPWPRLRLAPRPGRRHLLPRRSFLQVRRPSPRPGIPGHRLPPMVRTRHPDPRAAAAAPPGMDW